MAVRTRILLLLGVVIVTFTAGLAWLNRLDEKQFRSLTDARLQERSQAIDAFLKNRGQPLETFVEDNTTWDGMAAAVDNDQKDWLEQKLSDAAMDSYQVHALWIYKLDGAPLFVRNHLYAPSLRQAPLPTEQFALLLGGDRKACHFFTQTAVGLLEIRGAAIRPSAGPERGSTPHGYLFAGRLWSKTDMNEMSLFTGYTISLMPPSTTDGPGVVILNRVFNNWDGTPVSRLLVRDEAPLMDEFHRLSTRIFISVALFSVAILILVAAALRLWVARPLRMLSSCLRTENPNAIEQLAKERSEFGIFARLMRVFFEQRQTLINAMRDRQKAESALAQSEEQLRQSHKMEAIGQLAGGVAHDFNNLLTAIMGHADLLRERMNNDRASAQDAKLILQAADQAAGLTRQLLTFSRKQVLHPRVLDLNALVANVEKLLRRIIGEHIELRVRLSPGEARVRADRAQLEQVILNLAVNARDAMPRGGVLTIETGGSVIPEPAIYQGVSIPNGTYVTFSVSDTGCGMDEETKERIFEPFFTTKELGKGTGLGLATVYGVVHQSAGIISVESALDAGTTFTIHLPRETADLEEIRPVHDQYRDARGGETVLVVEDNVIVRQLICTVLEDHHYRVLCSPNGPDAITRAARHAGAISILISDVVMPQMSGPEVASALRAERPDMRVLFVSGYSNDGVFDPAASSAPVSVLEKPFTPPELLRKVHEMLHGP